MTYAKFEKFAETYLKVTLRGDSEWMCVCPLHDDRGASLQFNIFKGLWVCFGCQEGGTAKSLARKMDVSYHEPTMKTGELLDALQKATSNKTRTVQTLPESSLRRYAIDHPYWAKRGFTEETIEAWNLGYDFMNDVLTIPYRTPEGDLLGTIKRRLTNEFPRYLYPKGFDRTGSLFGSWKAGEAVVLQEGSLDAIKTWQNLDELGIECGSMAFYGSSIHPRQVKLLRRLGVKHVIIFTDYDEAGIKATQNIADQLEGFIVEQIVWDDEKYCPDKACVCLRIHRPDPGMLHVEDFEHQWERRKLCSVTAKWSGVGNHQRSRSQTKRGSGSTYAPSTI